MALPNTYVAGDANDQLLYTLDEAASPWANTGAAGALNLADSAGVTVAPTVVAGLYSNSVNFPGPTGSKNYIDSGAAGTSVAEITTNITVSCFVYLNAWNSALMNFWGKAYRPDASGWTAPFWAWWLGYNGGGDGRPRFGITVAGTQRAFNTSLFQIPLKQWCHIGFTFDGTTLLFYGAGVLTDRYSISGTIDYGTHGPYAIGGDVGNSEALVGIVDDCRVANVVRSASYFRSMGIMGRTQANTYAIQQRGLTGRQQTQDAAMQFRGPSGAGTPNIGTGQFPVRFRRTHKGTGG